MVIATHVIISAHGFWLPNDPRGSWSDFVGAWELFRYGGRATKTTETRSLAGRSHDYDLQILACAILPAHVHLVLRAHRLSPAKLVIQLKGAATEELRRQELHPFGSGPRPPK